MSEQHDEKIAPETDAADAADHEALRGRVIAAMVLYTVLRLLLFAVVFASVLFVIGIVGGVQMPLLVGAMVALVVSLPLSMVLFRARREQLNEDIALWDERRARARRDLRAALDDRPDED